MSMESIRVLYWDEDSEKNLQLWEMETGLRYILDDEDGSGGVFSTHK